VNGCDPLGVFADAIAENDGPQALPRGFQRAILVCSEFFHSRLRA
jgi:hypothetical protein